MTNKEEAYKKISELVERFGDQIESYKKTDYNETQTRRDFIDPFFKALGWDIDNEEGYAESYREVIHEDKIKVSGATKAPDYSFRLVGGKRLFFVEAKKPSVDVKTDIHPAYQVRRYGWSAKLAVSIITDFEEFSVYDCTKKPLVTDKASVARIKYLTFDKYIEEFDFLWETFSKERVLKGSFDKFVQSDTYKKGTATVDKEFLQSLDNWRTYLATSISWNNKELAEDEINFAVQQTIDRIIFLRIAEDRGVEVYGNLKNILRQGEYYQNLFKIFQEADDKYNSGLFDFKKDSISKNLKIENKIIKTIISELYYPESPYEFSVLSVEILGSAYEQFLGKVIRITPAHHAKIEEKPEVRKAGGVYYTPQYIVDYIVKNTVGKLIENKTPKEISKIKIVDPACGSGSFLIGAYQCLLDYHKNYYFENGKHSKGNKDNPVTPAGNLTTAEKKRILINNIFGVDIDVNAVEVTKLSLLLKCMEGETSASIAHQLSMFHERVLPTLDENIKSGNSLISTDYYKSELDFGEEKKIKPFNWQKEFQEIFKYGGFDAVIGNPPYVFTRDVEFGTTVKNYYKTHYLNNIAKTSKSRENQTGKVNLYGIFIVKGVELLNKNGQMGFIIPNTVLRTTVYESVRKYLLDNTSIHKIVDLKAGVFEGVTASTILLFLGLDKEKKEILVIDNVEGSKEIQIDSTKVTKDLFENNPSYSFNIFVDKGESSLFNKMKKNSINLSEAVNVFNGIATYADKQGISETKKNNSYKKLLVGKDIKRYYHEWHGKYVEYVPAKLQRARDENIFLASEKLIMQRIGGILVTSYDDEQYYTFNSVNNILSKDGSKYSLKFIMALLNSNLFRFYYVKNFTNNSSLTVNISKTFLDKLPLIKIDFSDNKNTEKYNSILKDVDLILKLNAEILKEKLQTKINQLKGRIDFTEEQINNKIYQLYELTEAEIKIVEG